MSFIFIIINDHCSLLHGVNICWTNGTLLFRQVTDTLPIECHWMLLQHSYITLKKKLNVKLNPYSDEGSVIVKTEFVQYMGPFRCVKFKKVPYQSIGSFKRNRVYLIYVRSFLFKRKFSYAHWNSINNLSLQIILQRPHPYCY